MKLALFALAGIALVGGITTSAPVQSAPAMPYDLAVSATQMTLVRQRCGEGMKRANNWQDKQGAWHGPCVAKHPASATGGQPGGAPGQPAAPGGRQ